MEGNIKLILALGHACGGVELIASLCGELALWHRQKSQLFIASELGKMQSWPYLTPPKSHKNTHPQQFCRSEGHSGARVHKCRKPNW